LENALASGDFSEGNVKKKKRRKQIIKSLCDFRSSVSERFGGIFLAGSIL